MVIVRRNEKKKTIRSIGNDRYEQVSNARYQLPTNTAYIMSVERAQMLHRLQPNQFYTLDKDADANWFTLTCLSSPETAVVNVRSFNVLYRRFGEVGLLAQWRRRVQGTLDLTTRAERAQSGTIRFERSWAERSGWMGALLVTGWSAAGAALMAEVLVSKCNSLSFKNKLTI